MKVHLRRNVCRKGAKPPKDHKWKRTDCGIWGEWFNDPSDRRKHEELKRCENKREGTYESASAR